MSRMQAVERREYLNDLVDAGTHNTSIFFNIVQKRIIQLVLKS